MVPKNEIDYRARLAFLNATTDVIDPAPIDTLLEKLPEFSCWRTLTQIDRDGESAVVKAFGEIAAEANCRISRVDGTPEAAALRNAIAAWMQKHGFRDDWIADAALCTLNEHAAGRAKQRAWHFSFDDADQNQLPLTIDALHKRDDETLREFLARADREWNKQKKAYVKSFQFRFGLRKGHRQPAKWTALIFEGSTFAEIARIENQDRSTVRKAVEGFRGCAKLRLPPKKTAVPRAAAGRQPGSRNANQGAREKAS